MSAVMGRVFRYISDDAMYPCGGSSSCHHCESTTKHLFAYFGTTVKPELAANPKLAADEPDISEVCASCILGGNVRKHLVDSTIQKTINRFARDKALALHEFHQTPDIPLFLQHQDWPMCCGTWCEYIGVPNSDGESVIVPTTFGYWEHEPRKWESAHDLRPESLREVSLFRCVSCDRRIFTWQFT